MRTECGVGWGPITALHFLTDLGVACKPDVHMVRTVRHMDLFKGLSEKGNPNKKETIQINQAVFDLVGEIYGSVEPGNIRYVDKVMMEFSRMGLL